MKRPLPTPRSPSDSRLSYVWEWILGFVCGILWFVVVAFIVVPLIPSTSGVLNFPIWLEDAPLRKLDSAGGTWELHATRAQLSTPEGHWRFAPWVAAVFMALIAFCLGQLRHILRSVRHGSQFNEANMRRLRRMGWIVLGIEALHILIYVVFVAPIVAEFPRVDGQYWRVSTAPDLRMLLIASLLFIFAEVFRRGTAIQKEQELTV